MSDGSNEFYRLGTALTQQIRQESRADYVSLRLSSDGTIGIEAYLRRGNHKYSIFWHPDVMIPGELMMRCRDARRAFDHAEKEKS